MSRKKPVKICPFPDCGADIHQRSLFCWDHWFLLPRDMQISLVETLKRDGLAALHKKPEGGTTMMERATALIERSIRNGAKAPPKRIRAWVPARRGDVWGR